MFALFTEMVFVLKCYMYFFIVFFFLGCLKQPTASTGPAQRVVEQPAAAETAKKAMEQSQPDPQPHPLPQPQPTAAVEARVAPQFSTVWNTFYFFFNSTEVRVQFILEEVQKVTRNKEKARMLWDAGWHLLIVTPLVQWGQLLSTDWSVWISQLWFKSHGQGKMKNVTCVLSLFHLWALLLDCPLSL